MNTVQKRIENDTSNGIIIKLYSQHLCLQRDEIFFLYVVNRKAPPTSDTSDLAVKKRSQDNRPDLKVDSIYAALSSLVYVSTTAGNRAQLESHKEDYFTAIQRCYVPLG